MGCIFIDRVRNYNLVSGYKDYVINICNPCAEYFGNDGNSCLLQSINLYNLVDNKFESNASVNYDKLEHLVRLSIRMMNQTQDYGYDMLPLDKNRKNVDDWRSIGLGVFGLADMLIALKLKYGSKEALEIIADIFDKINLWALDESCNEAKKYGTFGKYNWESQKKSPLIQALLLSDEGRVVHEKIEKYGLRNSSLLSCAPTGCQKKETLVATSNGLLRLSEIVNVEGDKWQERGDIVALQEKGTNLISKGFINGYANTKKIKLYSGIEMESTWNHKYRVIRNGNYMWVRADEIKLGDIIPSRIGYYNNQEYYKLEVPIFREYNNVTKKVILPSILDEKFAFILGCYYANGSTKKNYNSHGYKVIRFSMNAKKENDINKLMEYCYDVFGVRPKISISKNRQTCADLYIASVNLCRLFEINGLIKGKAHQLEIPKAIRCSSISVIKSFIDGYFMCDGSTNGNSTYIDTVSYQMAQDFAILFRSIGIDIKIITYNYRSNSIGDKPLYRVYFGGRMSLNNNGRLTKAKKQQLHEVQTLLGEDFIFDEVVSIENSHNMTYDIEVEDEHYYLANGVVSHNTISLFMGRLSGGVEPLFKCGYDRTSHQGENKNVVFRVFSRSIEDLLTHEGLPHTLSNEEIKEKFDWVVESQDITPIDRIATQSVMNEYIDNAISSTINLPNSVTWQDIFNIYVNAWKQKCKGITIFRDGCSRGNILGVDTSKKETKEEPVYDTVVPVSRRGVQEVSGSTFRLKTACVDKFYIHINKTDEGELFEIFANPSSGCQSNIGTITRLVSMALRSGIKVSEIIKELRSMKCPACQTLRARGEKDIELSCGNAIAHALEMAYNKETKMVIKEVKETKESEDMEGLLECPQCHKKTLRPEGKCFTCGNCGYNRCD